MMSSGLTPHGEHAVEVEARAPPFLAIGALPGKAVGEEGELAPGRQVADVGDPDDGILHMSRDHFQVLGVQRGKLQHGAQFPARRATSAPQAASLSSSVSKPRSR